MEYLNPIFHIVFITIGHNDVKADPETSSKQFKSYDPFVNILKEHIGKTYPEYITFTKEQSNQIFFRKCKRIITIPHRFELSDASSLMNQKEKAIPHIIDEDKKSMLINILTGKEIKGEESNENQHLETGKKYEEIVKELVKYERNGSEDGNIIVQCLIPNQINNNSNVDFRKSILLLLLFYYRS